MTIADWTESVFHDIRYATRSLRKSAAFTGGCKTELAHFRDHNAEFQRLDSQVLGISVDTFMSLRVFANSIDLNYPLLSDFPSHDATGAYGTYDANSGTSRRVTYVVDKQGIIRAEIVSDDDMSKHATAALEAVQKLQLKATPPM